MPERRTKKPMTYKERVAENERALKAENEAFERQKEKLLKKHEGEFVIMYKGKVFDHDPDCHTLLQRAVPMSATCIIWCGRSSASPCDLRHRWGFLSGTSPRVRDDLEAARAGVRCYNRRPTNGRFASAIARQSGFRG